MELSKIKSEVETQVEIKLEDEFDISSHNTPLSRRGGASQHDSSWIQKTCSCLVDCSCESEHGLTHSVDIKEESSDTENPADDNIEDSGENLNMKRNESLYHHNKHKETMNCARADIAKLPAKTVTCKNNKVSCVCDVCNLLIKEFATFDCEERRQIILRGRPTPSLPNLTKQTKAYIRHFQTDIYKTCEWLTGCKIKSLLFCWPCLLFSTEKNLWNRRGFSDLNNIHKLTKRHSSSIAHIQAIVIEKTSNKTRIRNALDTQLIISNEQHNQEVRKNREIFRRLIDVVCFLGQHEYALQGHKESEDFASKGNYVDLLTLLSKYDETLKIHFANSTVFKEISNIQHDIILSAGSVALKKIKSEIGKSSFAAIIFTETTDISNVSQLSKVVRYVTKEGVIKERFLGFLDVTTPRTATALYDVVQTTVAELDCSAKLIGQSYDGAAVMVGELGALKAKVNGTYPRALFVHCMVHRLDLVLQQSVSVIKECKVFFATLSGIASFFFKSSKRRSALYCEVYESMRRIIAPTQWNCNGRLLQTVFEYRQPLIHLFEKIIVDGDQWDHETVIRSRGYLDVLKTEINFNFLIITFSEIFPFCDNLFAVLQENLNDINFCVIKIEEFKSSVVSKRAQFGCLWNKLQHLELQIEPPRRRMRPDFIEDEKSRYRSLFLKIIANICMQLEIRFKNFEDLKFLELVNFKQANISKDAFDSLRKKYSEYFDFSALRSELLVIYNTPEGINKNSVSDLLKSVKDCGLENACPGIIKLCELTLTLPTTSASTERSFSTLKRIKNFIRNSTDAERLNNLALLSIEKELFQDMAQDGQTFYDDVIDEFAKQNRRIPLIYK